MFSKYVLKEGFQLEVLSPCTTLSSDLDHGGNSRAVAWLGAESHLGPSDPILTLIFHSR